MRADGMDIRTASLRDVATWLREKDYDTEPIKCAVKLKSMYQTCIPIDDSDGAEENIAALLPCKCQTVEEQCMEKAMCRDVRAILAYVPEQDRQILQLYFEGDENPQMLDVIGKEFGLPRERVRQSIAKALRRLRDPQYRRTGCEACCEEVGGVRRE